jgi:putative PIN family toxin of toxin-antitoxin system
VLDTNVLVSGMINAFGPPGRIVDLIREGEVELVVDDRILDEYKRVLNRPKFKNYFSAAAVRDILTFLQQNTHYVVAVTQLHGLPDPDDVPFLEVALTAAVPLVTGNAQHFPADSRRSVDVLTPADFLRKRRTHG